MPLTKLSRKYHILKSQGSTPDSRCSGGNRETDNHDLRADVLASALSKVSVTSTGSLDPGVTMRKKRAKPLPLQSRLVFDDEWVFPVVPPVNDAEKNGRRRSSLSIQSSFAVTTDCAGWRRLESTHLDHLSHHHDDHEGGISSICTEDFSTILTEDDADDENDESFHSAKEEISPVKKAMTTPAVDPKVFFSLKKRKKSLLFDKDQWKKDKVIYAGESGSNEDESPINYKAWKENTSKIIKRRRSRMSLLGKNTVTLLTSDSDSQSQESESRNNSDQDSVSNPNVASEEFLVTEKGQSVERWITNSPFQSPIHSPSNHLAKRLSFSGESSLSEGLSQGTSNVLDNSCKISQKSFAVQVDFTSDASDLSSPPTRSIGLQTITSSSPNSVSSERSFTNISESSKSIPEKVSVSLQVSFPDPNTSVNSDEKNGSPSSIIVISSSDKEDTEIKNTLEQSGKKNAFGNYLYLSSSSSGKENVKPNRPKKKVNVIESSSSPETPLKTVLGRDDAFNRLLNDHETSDARQNLGATFPHLSPVNEEPVTEPVVLPVYNPTSSDTDYSLKNFAFAPPYHHDILKRNPPLPPSEASNGKKHFTFKPKPSTPSSMRLQPTSTFGVSKKLELRDDYPLEPSMVEKLENVLQSADTLSFLSSLSLDEPDHRCHLEAQKYLINYKRHRNELTTLLFHIFNAQCFGCALPNDLSITWNARLTKTAGMCIQRRMIVVKNKLPQDVRLSRIELSTKVLDSPDRLRDTLVHEMCHATAWMVSGYRDGHGPIWKSWASKAMSAFSELPIIARCHSYAIRTKYEYRCTKCGYTIGRHSKSLDLARKCCGYCRGQFELVTNTTSKSKAAKTPQKPSAFSEFVKDNYKDLRTPGSTHSEVMKKLSEKFAKTKVK